MSGVAGSSKAAGASRSSEGTGEDDDTGEDDGVSFREVDGAGGADRAADDERPGKARGLRAPEERRGKDDGPGDDSPGPRSPAP
jgi:hypothetical protein